MNRVEGEKALKRYLKRSIGYSLTILVGFLINGQVSLGADINKELQIQDLLKSIEVEKEELNNKLLELDKELSIVKNSKDSSIQFFLSTLFENRKAKKSDDNGFSKVINDWEESLKDKPNIDIPDIRDDVKPVVPDIPNPLPNEDNIVVEPDFDFGGIPEIVIGDKPIDIELGIGTVAPPNITTIDSDNFQKIESDSIVNPGDNVGNVDIAEGISTEINVSTNVTVGNKDFFTPPSIDIAVSEIKPPTSFTIKDVKINATGFDQDEEVGTTTNQNHRDSIVQNYSSYQSVGDSTNIRFSQNDISYGIGSKEGKVDFGNSYQEYGKEVLYLNGKLNGTWDSGDVISDIVDTTGWLKMQYAFRKYFMNSNVATFITDLHGNDTIIEGNYNINYTAMTQQGNNPIDSFVRMFLSVNPAGLATGSYNSNTNSEQIKITKIQGKDGKKGEINLTTGEINGITFNGNLIAMEHQLWDRFYSGNSTNFANSYSVLLNNSTINLGNNGENGEDKPYSKNMIGIMVDLEQSNGSNYPKSQNHKTINNETININGTNSIGFSFEEFRNEENLSSGDFILRDDAYLGKININGTQNYGFRMANIFNDGIREDFNTYFDKVKVIGNTTDSKIEINYTGSGQNKETIENYTSEIVVAGNQNAGMVVGKSLSNSANGYIGAENKKVNPIANFENISILVAGDQTIGFVRDKNYSDNNTNDMVITNENLKNVRFGESATNSVLFRSEMYGITNETTIDVTPEKVTKNREETLDENEIPYNIAMQATRQSWDKDGDGNIDTNSSGSVTNNKRNYFRKCKLYDRYDG